jgi:hypothetical protein
VLASSRPLRAACGGGLRPALTTLRAALNSGRHRRNDPIWASPTQQGDHMTTFN